MALQTINVCDELKPGNSVLSALPIFHVFGLALCVHTCLISRMTAILVLTLNTKKIMDDNSSRSNVLNSLVNALQEVDAGTLNHLKRTQEFANIK